jgi:hypothetical protein
MNFPFGGSHQAATAPMQSYVKTAGAGQTPNPFSAMLNPMTPNANDRKPGRNRKKNKRNKRRGGDVQAPGNAGPQLGGGIGIPGGEAGPELGRPNVGIPGAEQGPMMNPFSAKAFRKMVKQMKRGKFDMPLEPTFMMLMAQMMGGRK